MNRFSLRFNPLLRQQFSAFRQSSFRRFNATAKDAAKNAAPEKKATGIKALIQEYGYSALGVYVGLSFIDLPICFYAVHSLGEERIGTYQNSVKQVFGYGKSDEELAEYFRKKAEDKASGAQEEKSTSYYSQLFTEFLVAYGIHKSLFFIRIPITAAITPSIVARLRMYGFNIGKKSLLPTKITGTTVKAVKKKFDPTATNAEKFGTTPTKGQKGMGGIF
ncbi:hypothetical protein BABINDRAFT_10015 [Babjeviella inositovora NRRL Y-12698]|uniref:DUF1279 domain-containing protein n=1 Tax=Babjeviella inositovora NRRL Y-12698 TaxID=984486 RepID=A0A1E3QJ04_9ASCO|nr:uncharacterized protein BABINDRAFT_10015 [Babjeviella inositovora NRRL Y-12698]ODQ77686.1 hypothetical protein BABINDRAFT_10015 [Babjeviella inositovora NRRL Y-12698]